LNPINDSLTYALGWVTYDWNGHRVVEHNGGSTGISALVSFIPEKRVGFLFLSNTSPNFMTTIGNAGNLIWPLILGEKASYLESKQKPSVAVEKDQTQTNEKLSDPDALLKNMIDALGGEKKLNGHRSLQIEAIKSYENQGITANLLIRAASPAKREEQEEWHAAGRKIGTLRIYFDGIHGGQETTFGQDAINDSGTNEQALRDFTFHDLLHLKKLYEQISIIGKSTIDGTECYVLKLTAKGHEVRLFVSVKNALVLKRESEGQSVVYHDYRELDGEKIPYETIIEDALGETIIKIKSTQFNVRIPEIAYKAHR
jgi:hypothetical protein